MYLDLSMESLCFSWEGEGLMLVLECFMGCIGLIMLVDFYFIRPTVVSETRLFEVLKPSA